jgi:endonuclease YncB( thermonuclease family)
VTSVGDGDNFRFFHTPGGRLAGWGWLRSIPTDKKALRNQTIHVRIAGIDAPELAHFGNPAQPYGKDALEWLTNTVLHRRVRVRIHSRDRFDRVVGNPMMRTWPFIWIKRDVGLEQIKAGMATVFRQGGAEYGGLMQAMENAETKAKSAKRGMWSQGKKLETPAAYKKRTRGEAHQEVVQSRTPKLVENRDNSLRAWLMWSIGK